MIVVLEDGREQVVVLDGGAPRPLFGTAGEHLAAFSWHGDGAIVAIEDMRGTRLVAVSADGQARDLSWVTSRVMYLYRSPDESHYVFRQQSGDGWQLWKLNATTGVVEMVGNMGSDPAGTIPPRDVAPEDGKQGPMYIAWSTAGRLVAFGGGWEPPFMMTIANLDTGVKVTTHFIAGYPGEIHLSPDGTR